MVVYRSRGPDSNPPIVAGPCFKADFLECRSYLPNDSVKVIDKNPTPGLQWEILMMATLLRKGFKIQKQKEQEAPDICLLYEDKKVWIECIVPEAGETNDAVPSKNYSEDFIEDPPNNHELRITQSLRAKSKQYKQWLGKKICAENEPFIIAISGKNIKSEIYDEKLPEIMGILYGIERSTYMQAGSPKNLYAPNKEPLKKSNGTKIDVGFFNDTSNSNISGVFFSRQWYERAHLIGSQDYCFVANIHAKNKCPVSFASFAQEYNYENGTISIIDNHQE